MRASASPVLSAAGAARRVAADRGLLLDTAGSRGEDRMAARYLVQGGPLGDFCDSLHDLVAHVLMWDEINLAVLAEARRGRAHWSLAARWEVPQAGVLLNKSGVAAGRELPTALLLHRFTAVRQALCDELTRYDDERWSAAALPGTATSLGALAQYVMTVPGKPPYWHAALHLGVATEVPA
jgi:hypothetical protein